MKKLIFMNHILHLGENTLAKQIQMSQELNNSPGLTSEVKDFIAKLGLLNCFQEIIPKNKWKYIVKKSIEEANQAEIRESLKTYKKVNYSIIQEEKFECKEYLSSLTLSQARVLFQHKYSMTENVKMNYKGYKSYAKDLWKCDECLDLDTESHLLWCKGYKELREGLDLDNNRDLCSYLQKIIQRRCKETA